MNIGIPELITILFFGYQLWLIFRKNWKKLTKFFFVFCIIVTSLSILNFINNPDKEPLTNMGSAIFIGLTILGLWKKNKTLLLGFPLYVVFNLGINASNISRGVTAIGSLVGTLIPAIIWFYVVRNLDYTNIKETNELK